MGLEGLRIPLPYHRVHAGWLCRNCICRSSPSPVDEALIRGLFQCQAAPASLPHSHVASLSPGVLR